MASGLWGKRFQCAECANNPSLRDTWGCSKKARMQQPTFEERENGVHYRYWNCPVLWLPDSVRQFLVLNRYCKEFGAAMPAPEDVSARFVLAAQYFDAKVNENLRLKSERG